MNNWMKKLAMQYENTRRQYPDEKLMIVFDIDGTIIDMRYMILHVLKSFDENHSTQFFDGLTVGDITVHENQILKLLARFHISPENKEKILDWYDAYRWSSEAVLTSHRPFAGVMETIRWFQMQPKTFVALNTGRPEILRLDTLRSLNKLGKEYKVQFANDLLYMNSYGWEEHVTEVKTAGVEHFRKFGYRVFAMVDNEPENLDAISKIDSHQEILLLHANTIFETKRKQLPAHSVSGSLYDITDLILERSLPRHIQFVWHGVNDEANLRQFLSSPIQWAECDVRIDPATKGIVLRHDSFEETPLQEDEAFVYLHDILDFLNAMGKSIKLDLKENGLLLDELCAMLKYYHFDNSRLWFNGKIDILGEDGFRRLRKHYPSAILQCPVDHLISQILRNPKGAEDTFKNLVNWGINRFSVKWSRKHLRRLLEWIDRFGIELNVYNVPDLQSFLKTVLLMPRSITADFNFPKWHYFGKGSGEKYQYYEYVISKAPLSA